MKTIYVPIVQGHSTDTGMPMNMAVLSGAMADDLGKVGPLGLTMVRYAAKGGVVKFNYKPVGTLDLVDASTFSLALGSSAKRMIDAGVIKMLAIELDAHGEVVETWLADTDGTLKKIADVHFAKMQRRSAGALAINKSATKSPEEHNEPMTPTKLLQSALRKAAATPQSVRDGFFRKDIATTFAPTSHGGVEEMRTEAHAQRAELPPGGQINVAELARANEQVRVVGEYLHAAMKGRPNSAAIAEAGQEWFAITQAGLGIDQRYTTGTTRPAPAPDDPAFREQFQTAYGKRAAAELDFRSAFRKTRTQGAQIISKTASGQVSARPLSFSKSTDSVDGESSAGQVLRRHSLETALARMQILGEKISAAMGATDMNHPAFTHVQNCLDGEKEN
jgi:hypothetical protein